MKTQKFRTYRFFLMTIITVTMIVFAVAVRKTCADNRLPGTAVPDLTLASIRAGGCPSVGDCDQFGGPVCSYSGWSSSCDEDDLVCTGPIPGTSCKWSSCSSNDGECGSGDGLCEEQELSFCCCLSYETECEQWSSGCECELSASSGSGGSCTACYDY